MDRDGTLNPDFHYLAEAERLELYAGVGEGLRLLREHGYAIVCITNQSGVARGFFGESEVHRIHDRMNRILADARARIDAFYYCPHAPGAGCACRKPGVALFERARDELGIEFAGSALIGDRALDIEAGERLGLLTVLVPPPGHEAAAREEVRGLKAAPDLVAGSFRSAALRLLNRG